MNTARIFKSGNSQAVRLPRASFRFAAEEDEIFRRGERSGAAGEAAVGGRGISPAR